jgi:transposase
MGYRYEEGNYWTVKHIKWMKALKFNHDYDKLTIDEYMSLIENDTARLARMEKTIQEIGEKEEYKARAQNCVQKLRALRGIDYLSALSLICDIGDFRRFASAGEFMSYLGLVPSEFSSGVKRHTGAITKTGNSHLRRLLVEAAWHYVRKPGVSPRLLNRRVGVSELIIAQADKAMYKLYKKFNKMIQVDKKSSCVAVTAMARLLAGYIWGIMTMDVK